MKQYFAYTRVSTVKQGEHGVSLQEQKFEIERYAMQRGMEISEWFEERETAAKQGRRRFNELMQRLRKGNAAGVIIHKIDRSARNLRDWVEIGQLTDEGIEVHFTRESLDLNSSSGRLAADVQAVVATNYIRNLREEILKGFYGRLKQGLLPLPAPAGYRDVGRGKPKVIDPVQGPLVQKAFSLYATGEYSQFALAEEMYRLGLRSKRGKKLTKNGIGWMLSNPFYIGVIRLKKNRQMFAGVHEPLISKELFDQVQAIAAGRIARSQKVRTQSFLFSRFIRCLRCKRHVIGERQKGHIYYRCHTRSCHCVSVREDVLEGHISDQLGRFTLSAQELAELDEYAADKSRSTSEAQAAQLDSMEFQLAAVRQRMSRLTDAYLDAQIDAELFAERKETLLMERFDLERKMNELRQDSGRALQRMREFVELVKRANLQYECGTPAEKRRVIEKAMSNREIDGKTLVFPLQTELHGLTDQYGDSCRAGVRRRARRPKAAIRSWVDQLMKPSTA